MSKPFLGSPLIGAPFQRGAFRGPPFAASLKRDPIDYGALWVGVSPGVVSEDDALADYLASRSSGAADYVDVASTDAALTGHFRVRTRPKLSEMRYGNVGWAATASGRTDANASRHFKFYENGRFFFFANGASVFDSAASGDPVWDITNGEFFWLDRTAAGITTAYRGGDGTFETATPIESLNTTLASYNDTGTAMYGYAATFYVDESVHLRAEQL